MAVLAAILGCSSNRQLALTILLPQTWSDGGALDSRATYQLNVGWVGDDAGVSGLSVGNGFTISVPTETALDVELLGTPSSGGSWRGELHGLVVPTSGEAEAGVLMLPVGQVGSFETLAAASPAVASATTAPLDDGRVLIVGGDDAGSAWIWDQAVVGFQAAPSTKLPWARHAIAPYGPTAFVLAGGDFAGVAIEIYSLDGGGQLSPVTLPAPQLYPSVVPLDGNTFLGCGLQLDGGPAAADLVVSLSGADGGAACSGGALVSLPEDGLLAIGASSAVAISGPLPAFGGPSVPRVDFGALADGTGGVLVLGGFDLATGLASAVVEDLQPGNPHASFPLSEPRADFAVVDLGTSLLAIGGLGQGAAPLADLEALATPLNGSGFVVPLGEPRIHPAAILIPGYRIVLILSGQMNAAGEPAPGIDLYAIP
jgi:hypothetical protein